MSELYSMLKAKKTGASSGGGGGATVNNATITIQKNGTTVDSFTSNQATDKTINITVPTSAADVSALPNTTKYASALRLTINSSTFVVTGQLKDQDGNNLGTAQTIDLPLESVVVNGSYDSQTKKVILTLQNGNTVEFSVADLVSGLQTELSASNKLNPAYINYDSTHAAVTEAQREQIGTNQTNIGKVQSQANWNTNNGVKNLIKPEMVQAGEYNSVTYTVNFDGSITVNGAATGGTSYVYVSINDHPINLKQFCDGNHILTGCPSGGSAAGYKLYAAKGNYAKYDYGDGVLLTETSETEVFLAIAISQGITASNLVFRPMIRPAFVEDATYEPYSLPNTKITPELIELVDSGAKNLSPVSTGTSSVASYIVESAANLPAGDYVFCWKNSVISNVSTVINCYKSDNTRVVNENEANSAVETRFITIPQDCVKFNLYTTGANQVTDLMICTKAAWDVSQKFVPYRPSYEETVEQVFENENNISSVMMSQSSTNGDLNDIAVNEFRVYTNNSAHLPSADWCFVHTSVNPDSPTASRLQFAVVMSTGVSYVRTMSGGEWRDWLQITNQ